MESTETVTECTKSAKMDLQLIVDSSMSVGPDNFNTMMKVGLFSRYRKVLFILNSERRSLCYDRRVTCLFRCVYASL